MNSAAPIAAAELPPAARPLLAWWLPRARALIGADYRGTWLFGSVVGDDFAPGWSDIDVCVVVSGGVSTQVAAALAALQAQLAVRYLDRKADGWQSGQIIEGYCLSPDVAAATYLTQTQSWVASGRGGDLCVGDPLAAFDRYQLAYAGRVVDGQPAVVAAPPPAALRREGERAADTLLARSITARSARWLTGMINWIARALVFWRDGELLSKSAACQREIERGSPYAKAYALALDVRRHGFAGSDAYQPRLAATLQPIAVEAAEQVRSAIATDCRGQVPNAKT